MKDHDTENLQPNTPYSSEGKVTNRNPNSLRDNLMCSVSLLGPHTTRSGRKGKRANEVKGSEVGLG